MKTTAKKKPAKPASKTSAKKTTTTKRAATPKARSASRVIASKPSTTTAATKPARTPKPVVGDRYRGTRKGQTTDYVIAKIGAGSDPIVGFYAPDRHPGAIASLRTSSIRWSLFLRDYAAKRVALTDAFVESLDYTRAQKAALTDRHAA